MTRKPIIYNRRFWWLYPETGRMERIYANERLRSQISQHAAVEARVAKEEAPPRRTHNPPRPPGTMPTLPSDSRDIGNRTLSELAHDYGWGSVARCTAALKAQRPTVYEAARANGRARGRANLTREPLQAAIASVTLSYSVTGETNEHQ
jgi:hypothetical protein